MLLLVMVSLTTYAGNGTPKQEQTRNNACSNILSGTLVSLTGVVIGTGDHDGLLLDTTNGHVTIYGIGPEWYWEDNKVDRPDIGDSVTVVAYDVLFSDGTRYIASSMTIGGETLILRDPKTGCPLWRGAPNR